MNLGRKVVLVDVDGTLADHSGVRRPYDWTKVHLDKPYPVVVEWVKNLQTDHMVIIVSGRDVRCHGATWNWLWAHGIKPVLVLMRPEKDNRPDTVVKKEILDNILTMFSKDEIAFVIDDRPSVIQMWRDNGLRVIPARGAVEPF